MSQNKSVIMDMMTKKFKLQDENVSLYQQIHNLQSKRTSNFGQIAMIENKLREQFEFLKLKNINTLK